MANRDNVAVLTHEDARGRQAPSADYRRYSRLGWLILAIVFGVFGVWAATAPLSGAVVATGEMAASSNTKTVRHRDGGVVSAIHVEEGDRVAASDLLVELDPTSVSAELERIRGRQLVAAATNARLMAEARGAQEIDFPSMLYTSHEPLDLAQIRETQQAIFRSRRAALESELAERTQRIEQLRAQIEGLRQVIASLDQQIASYREEVAEWSGLYEENLANKQDLREAQRRQFALEADRASRIAEIARLNAEIESVRLSRTVAQREYDREVAARLGDSRQQLIEASAQLPALEQRLARTEIRAPVDGYVVDLQVHTVGGVVGPGETVTEVVPSADALVIQARVAPGDVDNVRPGQDVSLRFPALNTSLLPEIRGTVQSVSADTLREEQNGNQYYLSRIQLSDEGLRALREQNLTMQAGMPVTAMIQTEERTLFSYMMKPISEMMARSLREP